MTITIPTDADGLEEILKTPSKLGELLTVDPTNGTISPKSEFGEFMRRYATNIAAKNPDIAESIRTQAQAAFAEFQRKAEESGAKPRPGFLPDADALTATTGVGKAASRYAAAYNPTAPGAGLDAKFSGPRGTQEYLKAIFHRNIRDGLFSDARAGITQLQNSFGSNVPADGGFLIPERLRADLLRVSLETAVVRSRARVVPMDSLTVPYPTIDSTSNASSVYGGIVGYWTEESGQLTTSQARFGRITLTARKLTTYAEVPNELFADSIISLDAFIGETFPEALAWFEDIGFTSGSGVGQPLGWLKAAATEVAAAQSGQATSTILWENVVDMYKRMLPSSLSRAVWVCNIDTFGELATMALSVGTGGAPIWLNNGQDGPPARILGRPVIFTEKVPGLTNQGDISFVDFGYYLIGDRQMIQADTSPHYKFANDQTAMRFIERVDGQPWLQSSITPNQGANKLSPFVALATR